MSCSYRIESIDFTESGIKVSFVPNAESLEVEISKEHTEQFFDVLRKNKYSTEHLYLNTVFKKYGNTRDALAINIPNESGYGTSPSEWIDCNFTNNESQHSQETVHSTDTIEFGAYKEKSLYWTKIGEYGDGDLYLCDSIVEKSRFDSSTNNYSTSEICQFLKSFYDEAFSPAEKSRVISHPLLHDFVFVLSVDEFCKYEASIKKIDSSWWLRSKGHGTCYAEFVDYDGSVGSGGLYVANDTIGVRPAIFLKKEMV